jgi:hypothetical protein
MSGTEMNERAPAKAADFLSIYQQGFVRVAACRPICRIAEPAFNLEETLRLAREGSDEGVALMVFPELGLSGYSIDDLLLQRALLDEVDRRLLELVATSRDLRPVLLVGAPLRREGRLYNCAVAVHRGSDPRRRAEGAPTQLPRVLREAGGSPPGGTCAARSSSEASPPRSGWTSCSRRRTSTA